jgi:hypothetical protein
MVWIRPDQKWYLQKMKREAVLEKSYFVAGSAGKEIRLFVALNSRLGTCIVGKAPRAPILSFLFR